MKKLKENLKTWLSHADNNRERHKIETLLILSALFIPISSKTEAQNSYCGSDLGTNKGTWAVNYFYLNGGIKPFISTTLKDKSKTYYDLTETDTLYVCKGETITPAINYQGSADWRHASIYIDYNKDASFYDYPDIEIDETKQNLLYKRFDIDTQTGIPNQNSELVSYSYCNHYSGVVNNNTARNSLGQLVQSTNSMPPEFKISDSIQPGSYRLRLHTDNNSAFLPCGRIAANDVNHIIKNGGRIIDMTITVCGLVNLNVATEDESKGYVYIDAVGILSKTALQNSTVKFVAKEKQGYVFDHWERNGVPFSEQDEISVVVQEDMSLTAYFNKAEEIFISVKISRQDSLRGNTAFYNIKSESPKIFQGDTITYTAVPVSGIEFVKWVTDNGTFISKKNPLVRAEKQSISLTAVFSNGECPILSPKGNTKEEPISGKTTIYISTIDNKGGIFYTLNGEEPTENDLLYDPLIGVIIQSLDSITVKAVSINNGITSNIAAEKYYFNNFIKPENLVTLKREDNVIYSKRFTRQIAFENADKEVVFTSQNIDSEAFLGRPIYKNRKEEIIYVSAGDTIIPTIDHYDESQEFCHCFVWVDWDRSNTFDNKGNNFGYMNVPNNISGTTDGNEIVSYTAYLGQEDTYGKVTNYFNSLGANVSSIYGGSSKVPMSPMPRFIVPKDACGNYNLRFNVDYSSLNPNGKGKLYDSKTFSIEENSGDIIDFTLRVFNEPLYFDGDAPNKQLELSLVSNEICHIRVNGDNNTITELQPGTYKTISVTTNEDSKIKLECTGNIVRVKLGKALINKSYTYDQILALSLNRVDDNVYASQFPNLKLLELSVNDTAAVSYLNTEAKIEKINLSIVKEVKTPSPITINGVTSTPTVFNFMSLPFNLNTSNIEYYSEEYGEWEPARPEVEVRIQTWNGQNRANENGNPWQTVKAGQTEDIPANTGFVIVGSNKYGDKANHRMKLRFSSKTEQYNQDPQECKFVSTKTYRKSGSSTKSENADWNFIGNPFIEQFTGGKYTIYKYSTTVPGAYQYIPYVPSDSPDVNPCESFLIQLSDGSLNKDTDMIPFDPSTKTMNVSQSVTKEVRDQVEARFTVTLDKSANARLVVCPESSNSYKTNEDAMYMSPLTSSQCGIFFRKDGTNTQVSVQPSFDKEEQIGIYTGLGTTHTISSPVTDESTTLYLKDNVKGTITNLNEGDYTFTAAQKSTINDRFTLFAAVKEATGIQSAGNLSKNAYATGNQESITLYNIESNCDVEVYNTNGMIVYAGSISAGTSTINVFGNGTYIISIKETSTGAKKTLKVQK